MGQVEMKWPEFPQYGLWFNCILCFCSSRDKWIRPTCMGSGSGSDAVCGWVGRGEEKDAGLVLLWLGLSLLVLSRFLSRRRLSIWVARVIKSFHESGSFRRARSSLIDSFNAWKNTLLSALGFQLEKAAWVQNTMEKSETVLWPCFNFQSPLEWDTWSESWLKVSLNSCTKSWKLIPKWG